MEKFYQLWKKFGKNFEEGGKLAKLSSFYDAFDTFLFTPQTTAKRNGTHIHDGRDSKRTMIIVVLALIPAMLFGMFNVGYQHLDATGQLAEGSRRIPCNRIHHPAHHPDQHSVVASGIGRCFCGHLRQRGVRWYGI